MTRNHPSFHLGALLALATILPAPWSAAAQAPADNVLRDFEPNGDYVLSVDGEARERARIYVSQRAAAFLLISSPFESPLLINTRSRSVETVAVMSLAKEDGGNVNILADAELTRVGSFTIQDQDLLFAAEGHEARLSAKPPLLGAQIASSLLEYSPSYSRGADAYEPDSEAISALKAVGKPVTVRVFFGSWCSFCKHYVPYVLKVESQLEGSNIRFEYYGLPQGAAMAQDPEAKKADVSGVPTGIVYVDGREAGRIQGNAWRQPEVSLRGILQSS